MRVLELNRRLAARGHEVTVVSGNFPGARDYAEGNLSYKFVGPSSGYIASTFGFAASGAMFVFRHSRDYDIVVEDFAPWNPIFSRLLSGRPSVLHLNHIEGRGILRRKGILAGLPFYMIESLYPRMFRHVTALSEVTRKKIGREDVFVVPAGINAETILDAPGPEGDFVLYVGRLAIANKGLDTLIAAMRSMAKPTTRLVIAGRGPDEQRLKEMAKGLDIEFRGFVDETRKLDLMRRSRLFVLPSRFEGWGIVVLEAAACGRPVVVSDIPELGFALEGGFGVAFRTGDAQDLASKLSEMLADPDARRRMGSGALSYVKRYTWERISEDYEALLQRIVKGGR